jgi:hypothetical protein
MPGQWIVEGKADRKLQVKARKGDDGSLITDNGCNNAELTLIGRIATRTELDELRAALRQIYPRLSKGGDDVRPRKATTIVHPALSLLGISSVFVQALHVPTIDNGIVSQRIDVVEWIEQTKEVKKVKQAPPTPQQQRAANLSVTQGRILVGPDGQERVDTGFVPPSAYSSTLEVNGPSSSLSELQLGS